MIPSQLILRFLLLTVFLFITTSAIDILKVHSRAIGD